MSDLHAHSASYVRKSMLPETDPPAAETGVIKWLRENLFSSWLNAILTILSIMIVGSIVNVIWPWAITNAVWDQPNLTGCRAVIAGFPDPGTVQFYDLWALPITLVKELFGGLFSFDFGRLFSAPVTAWQAMMEAFNTAPHKGGACFGVIKDRWHQLMFGLYPSELYWRPILSFIIFLVAVMPVLFQSIPRQTLILTALSPFILVWLIWGGSLWLPLAIAFGFVIGFFVYRFLETINGLLATLGAIIVPLLFWYYAVGPVADALSSIIPLEIRSIKSSDIGGFFLAIIIGVAGIVLSLPLGILLALGRQSDLFILSKFSVIFIEVIRGVPLIVWLLTASLLLNYFLPPGTNFDLTLRVIIMVTLFSSAYIAEVVRGGLAALPKGQYEAADALGLDYTKSMRLIVLPQALKISIPGIVNSFIGLFKDTTLVLFIGLLDPIGFTNAIRASTDWNGVYWELFLFVGLVFFIFCYSMGRYSLYLEKKLQREHR